MRVAGSLCALMVLLSVTPELAADKRSNSRLRCIDDAAARVVELALAESPTVRRLVDELEQTDLIVLVRSTTPKSVARGGTRLLGVASSRPGLRDGPRYLLIEFDPFGAPWDVVALLGHELQHAFEIGSDPSVRSEADLARLYTHIGWCHQTDQYETAAAIDVGNDVCREVSQAERQRNRALLAER